MFQLITAFLNCLFTWRVQPSSEQEFYKAQVVVALDGPGSDRRKAEIAEETASRYNLPAILQGNVAQYYPLQVEKTIVQHRTPGRYVDTHEVLAQAFEMCQQRKWTCIALIAHPDHLWRSKRVAEKLGFEMVLVPRGTLHIAYSKKGDEKQDTIYGRHKTLFRVREVAARIRDLKRGLL